MKKTPHINRWQKENGIEVPERKHHRRSERNLCNCLKKPEKISGLQRGLNPRPRDTGAMLYQLSYEVTDVGSRSIVGSYVPVKEMSVNDIWNKLYMNYGNEMKMKKWSSQWTQFLNLRNCINCVHYDDHFFINNSFPQFIYDLFHTSLTAYILSPMLLRLSKIIMGF